MKEAFQTMSEHPGLTVFLGIVFLIALSIIMEAIKRCKK